MKEERRKHLQSVRTVVVKLGTQLLSDKDRRLDRVFLADVARQVMALREKGIRVTIVSSGAIGAGMRELNLPKRPTDLAQLQAVAAVGQPRLMDAWAAAFAACAPKSCPVAQILLTREDIDDRTRFLNVRNTIHAIHAMNAVPIINENDTISTDELVRISFGDNDILAALVAHAIQANLLVLMTVVDGLLDQAGKSVRFVQSIEEARSLVRKEKSALGKGGMDSKLAAATMVSGSGQATMIVDGRMNDVLVRILDGEPLGTLFVPSKSKRTDPTLAPRFAWPLGTLFVPSKHKQSSRSRRIGSTRPVGSIIIDDGAVKALVQRNGSLLPAGITAVEGKFARGDCVAIKSTDGMVIATGLSNYPAEDVARIKRKKTHEVRSLLGDSAYDEVVHRDNLVINELCTGDEPAGGQ